MQWFFAVPPESSPQTYHGGRLFVVAVPLCIAVAVLGISAPDALGAAADAVVGAIFHAIDWFVLGSVSGLLGLALWLAFGPYGSRRMGGDEARPEFSTASWISMLFAAGMGAGLLFWGVAEPLTHFSGAPGIEPGTAAGARRALVITSFHWGLHAWAVYCMAALALGWFGMRRGGNYMPGAPLRAVFRGAWVEPVAKTGDLIAVLAVAFGVAGSVGMGTLQLQAGLGIVAGTDPTSLGLGIGLLVVVCLAAMISASTSLDKGIQLLSNINMGVAIVLMLFVFVVGPTPTLIRALVVGIGEYLAALPTLSFGVVPFDEHGPWLHGWTLTYLLWWIAWAPFVGVFIARISRGRTIREFVLGVLLAPTAFSLVWFAGFGGAGLHEEMAGRGGLIALVREDVSRALFDLLERLPLTVVTQSASLFLVFVFLVTSVDSATYVLGMLTSGGDPNPTTRRKLSWGVAIAGVAAALFLTRSVTAVRAVAVIGAVPFTLVMLLQVTALLRALRQKR